MLWVLKEPSEWDGSFKHAKHMFKLTDKEINAILGAQTILVLAYDLQHIVHLSTLNMRVSSADEIYKTV